MVHRPCSILHLYVIERVLWCVRDVLRSTVHGLQSIEHVPCSIEHVLRSKEPVPSSAERTIWTDCTEHITQRAITRFSQKLCKSASAGSMRNTTWQDCAGPCLAAWRSFVKRAGIARGRNLLIVI